VQREEAANEQPGLLLVRCGRQPLGWLALASSRLLGWPRGGSENDLVGLVLVAGTQAVAQLGKLAASIGGPVWVRRLICVVTELFE
jgi:hypothetical protein